MEDTITLTQAELDAKVEEAVKTATDDLVKKHNKEMYDSRQEIKKLKDATKDQETLKKEQDEEILKELNDLRAYKKTNVIGERLAKEGLPTYLKNDSRLINAEEGELDKVIKVVKKDYEDSIPKGTQHSTVIKTGGTPPSDDKNKAKEEFGAALKSLIGK